MKEIIRAEDINEFKRDSNIFSILLVGTILLPIPLAHFMGYVGMGVWGVVAIASIYYSIRVEKHKKSFNIQTYKEIIAFLDGRNMEELEKNQEYGKRPYQKFLLAIGAALLTIVIAVVMKFILK